MDTTLTISTRLSVIGGYLAARTDLWSLGVLLYS
jgi:hypothetical protein